MSHAYVHRRTDNAQCLQCKASSSSPGGESAAESWPAAPWLAGAAAELPVDPPIVGASAPALSVPLLALPAAPAALLGASRAEPELADAGAGGVGLWCSMPEKPQRFKTAIRSRSAGLR